MTEETAMIAQKMEGEGGTAKEPERLQEDTVTENAKTGDDIADSAIDPEEDALNASETIRDMAVGLVGCAVLLAAAGFVFAVGGDAVRWALGVLLGACVAGLMLRHLYVSVDRALDMDGEHASKYMKKSAVLRLLMAGAALAVSAFFPQVFHIFGVLLGVLCLKFTAYLQPLTHKAIKYLSKGR